MHRLAPLALAAAFLLPACATCRDGDIGSENCLARGGGLGSGWDVPVAVGENVVWWPWRLVAVPATGMVQGGVGWYEVTGEPVSATLTLPVGAALGALHGVAHVFGQAPVFVERDDALGDVLANPFVTDHEIWKYTTPPHGRPLHAPHAPMTQIAGDAETAQRVRPYGWAQTYNERLR